MGIYICLSRFCACVAHAQDNNKYNYLYVQLVAMVYTAKVWHAAAFSCNGLREASALMRISSII